MKESAPPAQFDLFGESDRAQREKEMRQYEADRRSWDGKLLRLQEDLDHEPQTLRESYEVRARRLEPIGLIYLWPATN